MTVDFKEIRELYDIWDNSFGISETEIIENESRLSTKLPKMLKEYYRQLGDHKKLNQTQDKLILPKNLYYEKKEKLIFYIENQSNAMWAIDRQDLNLDNPPVYISFEDDIWTLESNLTDFLTSMAYLQSIFALPFNANVIDIPKEVENIVRNNWKKVDKTLKIWNTEFFQNNFDEVLAFLKSDDQIDLFVATKTEVNFKYIDSKLNLNWDYYSLEV